MRHVLDRKVVASKLVMSRILVLQLFVLKATASAVAPVLPIGRRSGGTELLAGASADALPRAPAV